MMKFGIYYSVNYIVLHVKKFPQTLNINKIMPLQYATSSGKLRGVYTPLVK